MSAVRPAAPSFTQLVAERRRRWWWGQHPRRRERVIDAVHRAVERESRRSRDDPEEIWRCCPRWPRTLVNKWNGREFAARHGCTLPDLLWSGDDHGRIPWESLPDEFVIRPIYGTDDRGTAAVVNGRELLHDWPTSPPALTERLPRTNTLRRPMTVLIEEFIRTEPGRDALPLEVKCYTFGGRVGAIETGQRLDGDRASHRFYTPDWALIDDSMYDGHEPEGALIDRPDWLGELLTQAGRMGETLGTFMRIDFFAGPGGCVFNEFSSTPGWCYPWTPYCEELFGGLWAEQFPHAS
jgi:hypothetical protein